MPMSPRLLRPVSTGISGPVDGGTPSLILTRIIDGGSPFLTGPLILDGGTP